jgi:hypothetical protein
MQQINYIKQLADYVLKNLSKGYTQDALRFSLINQGYSKISVDKAIEIANKQLASTIPAIKEKPQITYKVLDEENKPIEVSEIEPKKGFLKKFIDFFK